MITRRDFVSTLAAALGTTSLASSAAAASAGERPRKTLLLHSAWDTINIGDIGHTPGTLHIIEQHLPGVHVILWAFKIDDRIRAMLLRRFPKLEIVQGSLNGTSAEDEALRAAIGRCDFFLRNSGMGQDTAHMSYCRKVGKPYGLYGQSYYASMVEGKGAEERIALLNGASFIYTRETLTLNILRKAGVKPPVLEFGPDGCFGIDVRDEARGLAFMKKHGLEDRKFITVLQRTNTPKFPGLDDTRTPKLNPLNPTPEQIADDIRRAGVFRELIATWVGRTGQKVLIAPETIKEMGHNKRLLYDPLPDALKKHVVNIEEFWNSDEAASIFARAHIVVCHEPHSPIIALANGTPIMHLYTPIHGSKYAMFKDIGLGEWVMELDATPTQKITDTLFSIAGDYPAALAKVKRAMAFVHQRQAATMGTTRKVIGGA
ncbi:MAG: polysaccharide pyruvyl transferase family protein [Verrucomicrobiota bacterium]